MEKLIKVLSIIATVFVCIALIAFIICVAFQKPLASLINSFAPAYFIIPAASTVYMLTMSPVIGSLCLTAGNKKIGIWTDIISVALIGFIIPGINSLISFIQATTAGHFKGEMYVASNAVVNSICSFPVGIAGVAATVALVVCGMSFVYKRMNRDE